MKMKELHIVPLSTQATAVLRQLQLLTGQRTHLFPNQHKPDTFMSENTMLYALYRMGYHSRTTGHGFRSTASTILNENGFRADVIERQLAHTERDAVRAAYNHAQYLPERRAMMQWWADYLDKAAAKKQPRFRHVCTPWCDSDTLLNQRHDFMLLPLPPRASIPEPRSRPPSSC